MEELGHVVYFYHTYRSGSVAGAAKVLHKSRSAVSAGLRTYERFLGFELFRREPWEPLPAAHQVYRELAAPYVERALAYCSANRAPRAPLLRVGATEFLLQEYLAPVVARPQARQPAVRVHLKSGPREEIERLMAQRALDLALVCTDAPPAGYAWRKFLSLQPVLFVSRASRIKTLDTLLAPAGPRPPLICPPESEGVCQSAQAFLRAQGLQWPVATIASSTIAVPRMVAQGNGVGLGVAGGPLAPVPGVRILPLPTPPLEVGAFWRGEPTPLLGTLLEMMQEAADSISAGRRTHSAARVV